MPVDEIHKRVSTCSVEMRKMTEAWLPRTPSPRSRNLMATSSPVCLCRASCAGGGHGGSGGSGYGWGGVAVGVAAVLVVVVAASLVVVTDHTL